MSPSLPLCSAPIEREALAPGPLTMAAWLGRRQRQREVGMENIAELGIFLGGFGIMMLSFAVFWAVSE